MKISPSLQLAWRSFWMLKKYRQEPLWAQLAVGAALALPIGSVMMLINGLLTGRVSDPGWWRASLVFNLFICLSVAYSMLAITRCVEWLLPAASIERISEAADWRAALVINAIAVASVVSGTSFVLSFDGWLNDWDAWGIFMSASVVKTEFLAFVMVVAAANWFWWRLRVKQDRLLHQAMEAQLRLLQGQIEPHFLFNTLANVQSLMDRDTPRAKLMLETFTDYLRASLGQLRDTDSTLAAELAMVRSYLILMQIRMEDRLRFEIDVSDEALAAALPPLLLQPLVENAIEHGLEPKIEGGSVRISAQVVDGRLDIGVIDDGLGLDTHESHRPRKRGNGIALSNTRERLRTRYGDQAALSLTPQTVGVQASLSIPYQTHP
ncbi:sensor histidine kinase [Undibacterium sp.]|uniref:sensor histidine kinase n=1 Tax=Undibacterium sp. TaxID=1914977 RepID=UPI0025DD2D72|nr:histidine kinase [Undibacterium sp.]